MNMTAKRFGDGVGVIAAPNAGSDSRNGRAIATPAPRSMERREIVRSKVRGILFWGISLFDIYSPLFGVDSAFRLVCVISVCRLFRNCGLETIVSTRKSKR
jgi:hypothetical protein